MKEACFGSYPKQAFFDFNAENEQNVFAWSITEFHCSIFGNTLARVFILHDDESIITRGNVLND